jgi:four helix bundle protein
MKTHHDLNVWQKSIELVRSIYTLTRTYPDYEKYGLCSQMQRAAVSVPSNIAEGAARNHTKEFIQFLYVAYGSLSELETQLIISYDLEYVKDNSEQIKQIDQIQKMLSGLIKHLKK